MTAQSAGPSLRIAVLGNFESLHTRRWLRFFAERGHEMHAISFYAPSQPLPGVQLHVLRQTAPGSGSGAGASSGASSLLRNVPPSLLRLLHAVRYQRAGLKRVLDEIAPDVFHAHYVVEHGFYGSFAGRRPYVVSAWGSDLLRDPQTPPGRLIAGRTLQQADYVTVNDGFMARRAVELGAAPERVGVVRIGVESLFLQARSVNLDASDQGATVISDRALEPLYHVDRVVQAFARLKERLAQARLVIVGDGSRRGALEALVATLGLGECVTFTGRLAPEQLRDALAAAQGYVSVPSSDSMAVSTLEAMAAGAFPVIADLPSVDGWIENRVNGILVPPAPTPRVLADALYAALTNRELRAAAAVANRARVEAEAMYEANMLLMERRYYQLAGHPVSDFGAI